MKVALALVVLVIALVIFGVVHDDRETACRYAVGGGPTTIELPCGLDAAARRAYLADHPELVSPHIPTLGPN